MFLSFIMKLSSYQTKGGVNMPKTVKEVIERLKDLREQNDLYNMMLVNKMGDRKQVREWLDYNLEEIEYLLNMEIK